MWNAFNARISLIANVPTTALGSALTLFQQAWPGNGPQSFQGVPNPLTPSTAQGQVLGMAATCIAFSNRVDFALSPDLGQTDTSVALRTIADATVLHGELDRIIDSLSNGTIAIGGPVNRVALFLQFVSVQPDGPAANQELMRSVPEPYRVRLSDEEAFALQVSRPQTVAGVAKVKLNVLTKWSVEQFQIVAFGVAVGALASGLAPQPNLVQPQVARYIGASVSLDCNSAVTNEVLTRVEQALLLRAGLRHALQAAHEYRLEIVGLEGERKNH